MPVVRDVNDSTAILSTRISVRWPELTENGDVNYDIVRANGHDIREEHRYR